MPNILLNEDLSAVLEDSNLIMVLRHHLGVALASWWRAVTSIVDALPNGCMEGRGGDEHIYVIIIWASLQNSSLPPLELKTHVEGKR